MGLPSGVQWASCNVGAELPSDFGLYFSWGNLEGHSEVEGYNFSQSVYDLTTAADIATDLSLDQDAAKAYLGAPWRMPTSTEFKELVDNCTIEWTTLNGVNGYLFISNVNGKRLFFPAAGNYNGTSLVSRGQRGYYWSSSYYSALAAYVLAFTSTNVSSQSYNNRCYGFSVRAVLQPT